MRHWRLVLLVLGGAASACAVQPAYVFTETYREPAGNQAEENLDASSEIFPNLDSLLSYRRDLCALSGQDQDLVLRESQAEGSDRANLITLMLASCAPDQTPGLLANYLAKANDMEYGPAGLEHLVALMTAQLRSYALVERRLRDTENRLERMITGLREIEAEMGGGDN